MYMKVFPSILPPKKVKLINNVIIFSGSRCSNRVFVLLNFGHAVFCVCMQKMCQQFFLGCFYCRWNLTAFLLIVYVVAASKICLRVFSHVL